MSNEVRRPHYIDNKQFYEDMIAFRASCEALPPGVRPKVPEEIGRKIMLICERLSYSRDFIISMHREEMVLDAIENCILYIRNFDPAKSKNPFAYFTQIAYYAFIRRAQKEKKGFMTKVNYAKNVGITEIIEQAHAAGSESDDGTFTDFANHLSKYLAYGQQGTEWKPEEKDTPEQPRKKRTTLAYQQKQKEKELAAQAAISEKEIEDALAEASARPSEIMDEILESEVEDLEDSVDEIEDEIDRESK